MSVLYKPNDVLHRYSKTSNEYRNEPISDIYLWRWFFIIRTKRQSIEILIPIVPHLFRRNSPYDINNCYKHKYEREEYSFIEAGRITNGKISNYRRIKIFHKTIIHQVETCSLTTRDYMDRIYICTKI